jgi:hypothetical protein
VIGCGGAIFLLTAEEGGAHTFEMSGEGVNLCDLALTHADFVALWETLDQTEVAQVPALRGLAERLPMFRPWVEKMVIAMKNGQFDKARAEAYEETKRAFLSSCV